MIQQQQEDPQTECQIYVEEWHQSGNITLKREFVNTVGFTYSNDVLNLGDPFSFTVPNVAGRYRDHFQRGAAVKMYLRNPNVAGGRSTLKHTGIVISRVMRSDQSGNYLDITCADLGWHLRENDAPLWYVLQGATWETLFKDQKFIHPSWGLKGLRTDNETARLIREGKRPDLGRAQAQIDLQTLGTTVYIQVEPGDKVADIILQYCKRLGRLFTVSPDGYMQIWTVNENQSAKYAINYHDDARRSTNNVMSCMISEDISSLWTVVTCIGERVGGEIARDTTDQNATKRAGTFINNDALPFRHNLNFCDGDIFDENAARKQARWKYDRGCFDSWSAVYEVRGHHNHGEWWEADNYCTVHDSVNGLDGDFYVAAVTYTRDERGDKTQVTLRKPGLLKSSFGVLPRAPRYNAPTTLPIAGVETIVSQTTTKAK